jgi:8-oxo-dGTP diphosphatase
MRKRRAARVLLFEPGGSILLVHFAIPQPDGQDFVFWAAPGGEIESEESELAAAQREIREELGLDLAMEGPIRVDRNSFVHGGVPVDNTDYYFRAACERDAPRLIGLTPEEIRIMKGIRWWTPEALKQTGERIFPVDLKAWVQTLHRE